MPTAAKLVAALLFAALAWGASMLAVPYIFEPGQSPGRFAEVNAALGALVGWRVAGPRAGGSWAGAVGYGITATVVLVLAGLFLHSFAVMIRQSLRKLYDGPVEALVDVIQLMIRNGGFLAHGDVLGALVLGGVLAGLVTEWAGRSFR